MSQLGIRWRIDGVPVSFITQDTASGRYRVIFERDEATLEQIEQIHWDAPTVKRVTETLAEPGLPEGCGFELLELRYQHTTQSFTAEVQITRTFWDDVTVYQKQLKALEETIQQQQSVIDAQNTQLQSMEADRESADQEEMEQISTLPLEDADEVQV